MANTMFLVNGTILGDNISPEFNEFNEFIGFSVINARTINGMPLRWFVGKIKTCQEITDWQDLENINNLPNIWWSTL